MDRLHSSDHPDKFSRPQEYQWTNTTSRGRDTGELERKIILCPDPSTKKVKMSISGDLQTAYQIKSTESPATSLLALTNTLQPVVRRCLLGWPA